jgi:hypothetical protein
MASDNNNTVFDSWLAAYGNHLEQVAGRQNNGAKLGCGENQPSPQVRQSAVQESQNR